VPDRKRRRPLADSKLIARARGFERVEKLLAVVGAQMDRASDEELEAAGLLEGLDGEDRESRIELLRRLSEAGVTMEELRTAVDEDRLALLPLELAMTGERLLSTREAAERTDLPLELVVEMRNALGLPRADPDTPVFSNEELEGLHSLRLFREIGIADDDVLWIATILGRGMFRFAQTVQQVFGQTLLHAGDTERDLAVRYAQAAEFLGPALSPMLTAAFTAHAREVVREAAVGHAERESGLLPDAEDVAVCFADIVGFTSLGGEADAGDLHNVAGRLARMANDVAEPPVRVIKTIGDAVMLVSSDAGAMVAATVELLARADSDDVVPALRAGIAYGPAMNRAGDWYGHTVNLASRVTGEARPSSVLVTQDVRAAAGGEFAYSRITRRRLRGVREPVALVRVKLPGEA
jgi:adenylate cyclase